jgi:hypothetical protein
MLFSETLRRALLGSVYYIFRNILQLSSSTLSLFFSSCPLFCLPHPLWLPVELCKTAPYLWLGLAADDCSGCSSAEGRLDGSLVVWGAARWAYVLNCVRPVSLNPCLGLVSRLSTHPRRVPRLSLLLELIIDFKCIICYCLVWLFYYVLNRLLDISLPGSVVTFVRSYQIRSYSKIWSFHGE